jgi:serine O-acetyltransferase
MTMFETTRSDIARMYELSGSPRSVSVLGVFKALCNPRLCPAILIRVAYCLAQNRLGFLARFVSVINLVLFGIEVSVRIPIGNGLFLPHTSGTVIGAASIGRNVTIFQGVTLGAKELDMNFSPASRPVIEDDVIIGAGAKVLGGIRIGRGARVGANAVVLTDVPSGAVAVGVPAQIVNSSVASAPQ